MEYLTRMGKKIKLTIVSSLIVALGFTNANADTVKSKKPVEDIWGTAKDLEEKCFLKLQHDYEKSVECYSNAANQGNAEAAKILGLMYFAGEQQDFKKSFNYLKLVKEDDTWLRYVGNMTFSISPVGFLRGEEYFNQIKQSAKNGDKNAIFGLGLGYALGLSGAKSNCHFSKSLQDMIGENNLDNRQNYQKAKELLSQISDDEDAKEILSELEKSIRKFSLAKKKAEEGDIEAQRLIADMYRDGVGVSEDCNESIGWYKKAAEKGDSLASYKLFWETLDFNWLKKAAKSGHTPAQVTYGLLLLSTNNLKSGKKWLKKAAKQGDDRAVQSLKELQEELDYFNKMMKLAAKGDANAQYNLARIYGTPSPLRLLNYSNSFKELEWYQKAARQGHMAAQEWLGFYYLPNHGVFSSKVEPSSEAASKKWFEEAAKNGSEKAKRILSNFDAEVHRFDNVMF